MPNSESRRASVITSLNLKGGVGKTHLCWLLASVCQERGHRCLIVDLDQQANITQSFLPNHADPTGVERLFNPTDNAEQPFLKALQVDPQTPAAVTLLVPPPGAPVARFVGAVTKGQIETAVKQAASSCGPNCSCHH